MSDTTQKRIITVQDISCVGRCSLTVALPILSAAGFETSILPTAILSTHTGGFTGYTVRDLSDDIEPIADHWKSLDLHADALYTGYLGSMHEIDLMLDFFERFGGDDTLIMVDPAMADQGKLYPAFDEAYAHHMIDLVRKADVICPNLTEAAYLLDRPYDEYADRDEVETILADLASLGPDTVVLTGVSFEDGLLGAACYDAVGQTIDYHFHERIDGYYHGSGDIYSSSLLGALMAGKSKPEAMRIAVEFTVSAIERTHLAKSDPRYGVDFEHGLGDYIGMLR